jgi:hypothetical protein
LLQNLVTQMFQQIVIDTIWDISRFNLNPHNVFSNKCYNSVKILFFTPKRVASSINHLVDHGKECLFHLIVTVKKFVFWLFCSTLSVLDYAYVGTPNLFFLWAQKYVKLALILAFFYVPPGLCTLEIIHKGLTTQLISLVGYKSAPKEGRGAAAQQPPSKSEFK